MVTALHLHVHNPSSHFDCESLLFIVCAQQLTPLLYIFLHVCIDGQLTLLFAQQDN